MKAENARINSKEIKRLARDVAMIKKVLSIGKKDPEGELTDWAKKQLKDARETSEEMYLSHENIKKKFN